MNERIALLQHVDPGRADNRIEGVIDRHHQHLVTKEAVFADDGHAVAGHEECAAGNVDQIDEVFHGEEPSEEGVGPLGQGAKNESGADVGARLSVRLTC